MLANYIFLRWWRGGGVQGHGGGTVVEFKVTVVARWWSSIFFTVAVVEVILTTVQAIELDYILLFTMNYLRSLACHSDV